MSEEERSKLNRCRKRNRHLMVAAHCSSIDSSAPCKRSFELWRCKHMLVYEVVIKSSDHSSFWLQSFSRSSLESCVVFRCSIDTLLLWTVASDSHTSLPTIDSNLKLLSLQSFYEYRWTSSDSSQSIFLLKFVPPVSSFMYWIVDSILELQIVQLSCFWCISFDSSLFFVIRSVFLFLCDF